jgi:hypothetical protein
LEYKAGISGTPETNLLEGLLEKGVEARGVPHTWPMPRQSVAVSQAALSIDAVWAWLVSDLVLAATLGGVALTLVSLEGSVGLATAYGIGYVATCIVLALRLRGAADAELART